jgi:feruloyl esterase
MKILTGSLSALLLATLVPGRTLNASTSCEAVSTLALPNATVTLAQAVEAGSFTPPGASNAADAFRALPAFCRVAATLKPTRDSDIKIEVWMPASGWNGKFQAVGNGAFNGAIAYPAMTTALARGYATSSTDTGHVGGSASFALGHPEKLIDFGWRAVHEMTAAAKKIIATYYDEGPKYSYWNGCSAGGRQGLKAAQRFPADFDGIIAGAPGLDWTGRAAQALRVAKALENNESGRLSRPQVQLLHQAAVHACDVLDGVKDGLIEDPRRCTFDPAVLQCQGADDAACLTTAQVETARLIYSAAVNPRTKREIAGLERGSELGWGPGPVGLAADFFRYVVFKDPAWDPRTLNFDSHVALVDSKAEHKIMDATAVDLSAFTRRGGKLILYQGWAENGIPPGNVVTYYDTVRAKTVNASTAVRLFMVPGMGHCGGGNGTSTFDMVAAMDRWKTTGKPPQSVPASRVVDGNADRTRPLCAWPQVAIYKGAGSTDDAANFRCGVSGSR